ncbi:hypothetical protein [Neobacillus mesonae]|uniref:hypothetical protein n=1 Tax=Neobacillus mesonae TaxID=1193713 RepID=UPI00203B80A0|nr:hypothetical protein [Neobacillus mesonae]MCM3569332.1 hypothetical protein [Neobacillus mesonae]
MKFTIRFFLAAILLLSLAACSNDTAANKSSDEKNKEQASETKEKANKASFDLTGYWKGSSEGDYYSLTKDDDTYSLTSLLVQKTIQLDIPNINNKEIEATVLNGIENYLKPGDKATLKIKDDNTFTLEANGDTTELTRIEGSKTVDPLDLVGSWMDDKDYFTITKDNDVVTFSFQEEQEQLEVSVEVTDVLDHFIFGKVTKILPEKFANVDDDLYLGSGAAFRLSDDKTKLSIMGDPELTKTDMSYEDFKAQKSNAE